MRYESAFKGDNDATRDEEGTFQACVEETNPARHRTIIFVNGVLFLEGESSWEPCDLSIQVCYATADLRWGGEDDQRWLSNVTWSSRSSTCMDRIKFECRTSFAWEDLENQVTDYSDFKSTWDNIKVFCNRTLLFLAILLVLQFTHCLSVYPKRTGRYLLLTWTQMEIRCEFEYLAIYCKLMRTFTLLICQLSQWLAGLIG